MCKAVDKEMEISEIRLLKKTKREMIASGKGCHPDCEACEGPRDWCVAHNGLRNAAVRVLRSTPRLGDDRAHSRRQVHH